MTYEWPLRFAPPARAVPGDVAEEGAAYDCEEGDDSAGTGQVGWVDPTTPPTPIPSIDGGSANSPWRGVDTDLLQQYWTHGAGPMLLLATNDSVPNPLYDPEYQSRSEKYKEKVQNVDLFWA
jgi:hypothetical protein